MSNDNIMHVLTKTVDILSEKESLKGLYHEHRDGDPLPSAKELEEIIDLARAILFPGYFGKSSVNIHTIQYQIGVSMERLHKLLTQQILAGLCFGLVSDECECQSEIPCHETASALALKVIEKLPEIRRILATDVEAAYNGDPAADSFSEIISCYPVIKALTNYRLAHELVLLGVPLIPRMMTEMAHSETGIDIHPGAKIGKRLFIDHAQGVVIGETAEIGDNVVMYHGSTLGGTGKDKGKRHTLK